MRGLWLLAALPPILAACAQTAQPLPPEPAAVSAPAPAPAAQPPILTDAELHGRWRIVILNDAAPRATAADGGGDRTPHLVFSPWGYGGSTGCNSFGGFGVLEESGRYYASSAGQTAIGCGPLSAQEDSIIGILTASPLLSLESDGTLRIAAPRGTMTVRREASGRNEPAAAPWQAETLLAGSAWTIAGVDGVWLREEGERRSLRFEAERWTLRGPCGARGGTWRQGGDRIEARPDPFLTRACDGGAAALDDRLVAMLGARPRFVTGPNGEILIGGGGHWATGERPRSPLADEAPLLAGSWTIVAIDGRPPAGGEAAIAFGPTGFSGSAGCNSFQGYFLAHGRRFYAPPAMATEMGCGPPLAAQERRVGALLSGAPRIALAGDGEIALVDEAGSLRLRRTSAAAAWAPAGRVWAGAPLQAELTMLDGIPLQEHYSHPATRLRLGPQRVDIETGCGRLGGIWRRPAGSPGASGIEFLTDPEPPPQGECAGALVARLPAFMRLLNGPARILIGASGELIVAGDRHWLAGRVLTPAARRRRR